MKANAPYEQEWKLLYFLVGHVFSFKKLMGLSMKYGHSAEMIHRYYSLPFLSMAYPKKICWSSRIEIDLIKGKIKK